MKFQGMEPEMKKHTLVIEKKIMQITFPVEECLILAHFSAGGARVGEYYASSSENFIYFFYLKHF